MLNRLDVENFRILNDFHIQALGRVNLIVGKNNSGKSTVLEAMRIYAGNANIGLLSSIARDHDERFRYDEDSDILPLQDFFTRKTNDANAHDKAIIIGDRSDENNHLKIANVTLAEFQETVTEGSNPPYAIRRRRKIGKADDLASHETLRRAFEVSKGGRTQTFVLDMPRRVGSSPDKFEAVPCGVVPTRSVSMEELAQIWDSVVFSDDEILVKEAMRFISPDFEALTFVEAEDINVNRYPPSMPRARTRRVPVVKLNGADGGQPLRSLGDGIARVFQLSLKILESKNGFLLIDEFENGFHYSVQEKIWNYVFSSAKKLNIQVFATTHSWDCIESFAKASSMNGYEGGLHRVGKSVRKSDEGKIIATEFHGKELLQIAQSDLEVR